MNRRFISVLVFAAVVSLGASLILYRLLNTQFSSGPKPAGTQLVLAARNLDVGTLIRESDLKVQDWPGPVPASAVKTREGAVGRGVINTIFEGEPLVETRLAQKGSGAGLAATIPAGMRAVAVRVNEVIGLAGFVVPGMKVDVLISGTAPALPQALGILSKTILQNITVLSAGQNIQKDAEGKPISVQVVNLLVTPEQAETLSLASSETKIQLVLRNPLDNQIAKTPGTAVANLFTGGAALPKPAQPPVRTVALRPPPRPVEKPPAPIVIEVINGNTKAQAKFSGEAQ